MTIKRMSILLSVSHQSDISKYLVSQKNKRTFQTAGVQVLVLVLIPAQRSHRLTTHTRTDSNITVQNTCAINVTDNSSCSRFMAPFKACM